MFGCEKNPWTGVYVRVRVRNMSMGWVLGTGVNVIIMSDVLYGLNRSHRMCLLCIVMNVLPCLVRTTNFC
jgi:hypothetical protein